jgi:hypothetical protein
MLTNDPVKCVRVVFKLVCSMEASSVHIGADYFDFDFGVPPPNKTVSLT